MKFREPKLHENPVANIEKVMLDFGASTRPSEKEGKTKNEDAYFILHNAVGIFDGMGGASAGEVASGIARDYVEEELKKIPQNVSLLQAKEHLQRILTEAHKQIFKKSCQDVNFSGMGTTADVAIFCEDQKTKKLVVGHVGDSRIYVLRKNGNLEQVTEDDNSARYIPNLNNLTSAEGLSAEQQQVWKYRNVIDNALGAKYLGTRIFSTDIYDGDVVLLCSDGISDNLTDTEIANISKQEGNASSLSGHLIDSSLARSREKSFRSKQDDMTAVVVKVSMR